MLPNTCHQQQKPHRQTFPLLNTPTGIVGWFPKILFLEWGTSIFTHKVEKKNHNNFFFFKPRKKGFLSFSILEINSLTRSVQSTLFCVPSQGTNKLTHILPQTLQLKN